VKWQKSFEEKGIDLPLVVLDVGATFPRFQSVADSVDNYSVQIG
jgi:hypothetical protein